MIQTSPVCLDQNAVSQLYPKLLAQIQQEPTELILELDSLQSFDSSTLAIFIALKRHALAKGKCFKIKNLPDNLKTLADLYGVTDLLNT